MQSQPMSKCAVRRPRVDVWKFLAAMGSLAFHFTLFTFWALIREGAVSPLPPHDVIYLVSIDAALPVLSAADVVAVMIEGESRVAEKDVALLSGTERVDSNERVVAGGSASVVDDSDNHVALGVVDYDAMVKSLPSPEISIGKQIP